MFSFMIVVNDNGELKSVSAAELARIYGNEQDLLVDQIEDVVSWVLRDREAPEVPDYPYADGEGSD